MQSQVQKRCYFSSIEEQSSHFLHSFKESQTSKDYLGEYTEEVDPTTKNATNCSVHFESEVGVSHQNNSLVFESQGGMKYVSQVENSVSNIFVMNEGIIIEFNVVHMPTYAEIKEKTCYQGTMDVEATDSSGRKAGPKARSRTLLMSRVQLC
jgi:hypothetical protein